LGGGQYIAQQLTLRHMLLMVGSARLLCDFVGVMRS